MAGDYNHMSLARIVESRSARKLIEKCFPQLKITQSRQILKGWDNIVLEIDNQYIFRFPRFRESEQHLRKEIMFLPILSRYLRTRVPNYKFVWRGDSEYPYWFAGYRKITGTPMTVGGFRKIWIKTLAKDIAGFLNELHSLSIPERGLHGIPKYTPKDCCNARRAVYTKVQRTVYPLLGKEMRGRVETFWHNQLANLANVDFEPVLIHGDLTSRNILFDPSKLRLKGILDWSDSLVGDPAFDFAGLFEINPNFGHEILRLYGRAESDFNTRIDLYLKTIPFHEIIWGITQNSEEFKTQGLRHLRQRII